MDHHVPLADQIPKIKGFGRVLVRTQPRLVYQSYYLYGGRGKISTKFLLSALGVCTIATSVVYWGFKRALHGEVPSTLTAEWKAETEKRLRKNDHYILAEHKKGKPIKVSDVTTAERLEALKPRE